MDIVDVIEWNFKVAAKRPQLVQASNRKYGLGPFDAYFDHLSLLWLDILLMRFSYRCLLASPPSGKPKQRTQPVYFLGKKDSESLGVNSVLPPPTYTRPRERDGPQNTGPISISLSTLPVAASRAMSLPLPTVVKKAT